MDWAFSSAYKGQVSDLREALQSNIQGEVGISDEFLEQLRQAIPEEKQI